MHDERVHAWLIEAPYFLSQAKKAARQLPPDAQHLSRDIDEAISVAAVATLGMPDELRGDVAAAHALLYRRRFPKELSFLLFGALSELRDYFTDLDRIAKSAGYTAPLGDENLPRERLVPGESLASERDLLTARLKMLLDRAAEMKKAESSPIDVLCDSDDAEHRQMLQRELLENVAEAYRAKVTIGLALAREEAVDVLGLSHSLRGISRTTSALAAIVKAPDTVMSTLATKASNDAIATSTLVMKEGEALVSKAGFGAAFVSSRKASEPTPPSELGNPFSDGVNSPPLFGRKGMLARAQNAIDRLQSGRAGRHSLFLGLRGVGKTTLLESLAAYAQGLGVFVIRLEAGKTISLVPSLSSGFRSALLQLKQRKREGGKEIERALRALHGFVSQAERGTTISFSVEPEPGLADSGDLTHDMTELFVEVGRAARAVSAAVVIFVDEFHNLDSGSSTAFITALHRVSMMGLPIGFVGAGLPQLSFLVGDAKSYAERLFDFVTLGPLSFEETQQAIVEPARERGVEFEEAAVQFIYEATKGYPFFVQQWAMSAWETAQGSPITLGDAEAAEEEVIKRLDGGFFKVRTDRLTRSEMRYVKALANLGSGPQASSDVASALGVSAQALGPVRASLVAKGIVFAAQPRRIEFTVPMFDDFIRRNDPK